VALARQPHEESRQRGPHPIAGGRAALLGDLRQKRADGSPVQAFDWAPMKGLAMLCEVALGLSEAARLLLGKKALQEAWQQRAKGFQCPSLLVLPLGSRIAPQPDPRHEVLGAGVSLAGVNAAELADDDTAGDASAGVLQHEAVHTAAAHPEPVAGQLAIEVHFIVAGGEGSQTRQKRP